LLKLGGSLVTDKTRAETLRAGVLERLVKEIAWARVERPGMKLIVSHGSGSFGHVPAARHGTRQGVRSVEEWRGFAEVSAMALRFNRMVTEALLLSSIPAISLQPSASAVCVDGLLSSLSLASIEAALAADLVPVIHGDVAFDTIRGGTIISTEEIMAYLVAALPDSLRPSWLLLAGETAGVYDRQQQLVPEITSANFSQVQAGLGASRGTDVTGGMASKVQKMLELVQAYPVLQARIFSGLEPGLLYRVLVRPDLATGTLIRP
jgi:isopentenyl phosphate kinase